MSAGFHEKGRPEEKKSSLSKKNMSPVKNFVDDLMFFGGDFIFVKEDTNFFKLIFHFFLEELIH